MMVWRQGFLVLEDGLVFPGLLRAREIQAGEVVFNTSHSGYEEIATDPSYHHQIVVMTAPQQGNYGIDRNVWQSDRLWIRGFVALDIQESPQEHSWLSLLEGHGVPAFKNVDTRSLVLHLREKGSRWGALVPHDDKDAAVREGLNFIERVRVVENEDWTVAASCTERIELEGKTPSGPFTALMDFGCKQNILENCVRLSRKVVRLPAATKLDEINTLNPDVIVLSNGPGDPGKVPLDTIKALLGTRPILGICMGHQLLGRALGGNTYKLKFGHRGGNHPVKDLLTGRIYVTSQNHGYAIDKDSLPSDVEVTHINLNDQTVSGIRSLAKRCWGVQFHPESHPGPHEAQEIFDQFFREI
jgi:carbamoyl-phosphate synthase small subunit